MIDRLLILGASGDLTGRYLLPALAELQAAGHLDEATVVGLSRDDWDTDRFRRHGAERLDSHASHVEPQARRALVSRLEYCRADVTDPAAVSAAAGPRPVLAYLALPPAVFAPAIKALARLEAAQDSRVVVEKPFGESLADAQELNAILHAGFPEHAVFRIDHFLGKQTVQNLLGLRFANRILEPVWNNGHVERVEVIFDETLALEGRAGYYDSAGALKDMVQNHLLQLLCLVGLEPPTSLGERDLRDRKVDLLRAVRRPSPDEVDRHTVRARYEAGRVGDREITSYVDEEGVDRARDTETFASVTLSIDNWRWSGVPFTLRTGKAMARDVREILVHFKAVPHVVFGRSREPRPNVLRIEMDPDRLVLGLNQNGPGDPFQLEPAELACEMAPQELSAYGRLLLDALDGDPTLSIRDDEAEECWRIAEPIIRRWEQGSPPLLTYRAGSDGPA